MILMLEPLLVMRRNGTVKAHVHNLCFDTVSAIDHLKCARYCDEDGANQKADS